MRLLVLDDDRAIVDTICAMASRIGVAAHGETDPEAFMRHVDTWEPDFLILDLLMPELDGIEIIRMLARHCCKASLILTSGVGSEVLEAARRTAIERGLKVAGAISKPLTREKLRRVIEIAPAQPPRPHGSKQETDVTIEELRGALDRDEIGLMFQPQIDCAHGKLVGFEALARWQHPQHGMIMPDRFIPLAESDGLMVVLADRIVEEALDFISSDFAESKIGLSINLSMQNLMDLTFADRVASRCSELGIEPQRITFELTETGAMEDPASALDLLTRLRMKRFRLSIDDFGTGYSSMVQLVRLPFTEIKIDKSFVSSAQVSAESHEVVRSVVALGKGLGLEIVAEGVEDSAMLVYVTALGCDRAQGFHVGLPLRADEVAAWETTWRARSTPYAAPFSAVS